MKAELLSLLNKITQQSQQGRETYLRQMASASLNRGSLSCTNQAHAMASETAKERLIFTSGQKQHFAILSAYNDLLSAHQPYQNYPSQLKQRLLDLGHSAQMAAGVPAMCDGITQGQQGMELSLFSRDTIALACTVGLSHQLFNGAFYLGICDKIVPGMLMAALRFGHMPAIFVPAGPMSSGLANDKKAKARQDYVAGKLSRDELLVVENKAYHSAGTCTFYGTANTNQILLEVMGLQLPGSSFEHPDSQLREHLTDYACDVLVKAGHRGLTLGQQFTEKTLLNGLVALLATGGSTNHSIHMLAIARCAGITITWEDLNTLSKTVPLICSMYPNGSADINQFHAAGGTALLIKELLSEQLLFDDVDTVMGTGFEAYLQEPCIKNQRLSWQEGVNKSIDTAVIADIKKPFKDQGGMILLQGNLGRAIVKTSAVAERYWKISAPAVVVKDQQELTRRFQAGNLPKNFVLVLAGMGPKACGMPELHQLMPALGALQDEGGQVALITDGRLSGASGKVLSAIHVVPEAAEGGLIGKIRNGDIITMDVCGELLDIKSGDNIDLSSRPEWRADKQTQGLGREFFSGFRQRVTAADQGAMSIGWE